METRAQVLAALRGRDRRSVLAWAAAVPLIEPPPASESGLPCASERERPPVFETGSGRERAFQSP
jgi:hypothetical protein